MDPITAAALESWRIDPWLVISLVATAAVYARGWWRLYRQMPKRFGVRRIVCFYGGLAAVFVAVASPLDAFGSLLLQAHMAQHMLLTMVAPPLLLLGAPVLPMLRGLPRSWVRHGVGPLMAAPEIEWLGRVLTHPAFCWIAFTTAVVGWHLPGPYELALSSPSWHVVEHACFFGTALLFWWPVVQPWPSRSRWPRWSAIVYLVLADLQNTAVAAFLVFCERVVYPTYASAPRLWGTTALGDQAAAGALMWVPGSIAFLLPAGMIALRALGAGRGVRPSEVNARPVVRSLPIARRRGPLDLLRVPVLGAVLRWRHFRRTAQIATFTLAIAVVIDGLFGPEMGPMNAAGVLPWTHWRGLAIVGLLAVGNVFCMACPFMLPRDLGRRVFAPRRRWPRALRSKWLAVGLVAVYLWAYEAFSLWDSPWWTAWIVVGYFAAAFLVDAMFEGASFCKYVCPIGQFHFVSSAVSPFEVKVRDVATCHSCEGHGCIRGRGEQRGCELRLFQPKKSGNLDCTFCLDCVHACPSDNVGIVAVAPAATLIDDRQRSSIGRLARRPDLAALALLLVFGAFANAAAMVGPVAAWISRFEPFPAETVLFVAAAIALPAIAALGCSAIGRAAGGVRASWREVTCAFAFGLVPLGFGMWLAHFSFHLVNGVGSVVPVAQRFAADFGLARLGEPRWSMACCGPQVSWLLPLEIVALDAGLLLTLYVIWRVAGRYTADTTRALGLAAPWSVLSVLLYLAGLWIVFQPMQMRGMMM